MIKRGRAIAMPPPPSPLVIVNPNALTDDEDDVFSGVDSTDIPLLAGSSVSIYIHFYSLFILSRETNS